MKLRLYGFFKQATEGPCTQPAPSFWDVIGKAKWGAWKNLADMPAEEAMTAYVEEIKKVRCEMRCERRGVAWTGWEGERVAVCSFSEHGVAGDRPRHGILVM